MLGPAPPSTSIREFIAMTTSLTSINAGLNAGRIIPFLGPGALNPAGAVPADPLTLATALTSKASVPHKLRKNLTGAAQYIENFKHRKTLVKLMTDAFAPGASPTAVHHLLLRYRALPLIVNLWYDDALQAAFAGRSDWGLIQGVSRSEHFNEWVRFYQADGALATAEQMSAWKTILYLPWGSRHPAENYLVSDSDFVEVLTEIDIQTPIPAVVQHLRKERSFLFLGCRFNTQVDRSFARQIMKRSSGTHWAVLPEQATRMEQKFLVEQNIERLAIPLDEAVAGLAVELASIAA